MRKATIKDLDALFALDVISFEKGKWTKKAIENELTENPLNVNLVEEDDGKIVGWLDFMITFNSATVMTLCVHPEHRRKGIAKALLREAERICAEQEEHVDWITLEVREGNKGAIALYEGLGYLRVNKKVAYYEDGEDAVYMVKSL